MPARPDVLTVIRVELVLDCIPEDLAVVARYRELGPMRVHSVKCGTVEVYLRKPTLWPEFLDTEA